jgi:hypothetical protein
MRRVQGKYCRPAHRQRRQRTFRHRHKLLIVFYIDLPNSPVSEITEHSLTSLYDRSRTTVLVNSRTNVVTCRYEVPPCIRRDEN